MAYSARSRIFPCLAALGLLLALAPVAEAQISPGKLSQAHAELAGSTRCLDCHQARKGVDKTLCLSCHVLLRQRLKAQVGMHAGAEYRKCESCHIEHHGREFELVWWGEEGMAAFDHTKARYPLEGAHGELACRDCHKAENIVDGGRLLAAGKDLNRTFLGLGKDCLSCHADQHQGQFDAACLTCHTKEMWTPASLFEHAETSFPLSGKHQKVACLECHSEVLSSAGKGTGAVKYRGLEAASCSDCHRDPHRGQLAASCSSCHNTGGWNAVDTSDFDHRRTRYPLLGRHRQVACADCHMQGLSRAIPGFERCATCHGDPHLGQFDSRQDGGDCASCHDPQGFEPTRFTLEDHQAGVFPLHGAHLAVPCVSCHQLLPAAELLAGRAEGWRWRGKGRAPEEARRFRFTSGAASSAECVACHRDPHRGEAAAFFGTEGCSSCHGDETWHAVEFDHAQTGFALEGAHAELSCVGCHRPSGSGDQLVIPLADTPGTCRECHEDPHLGQLDGPAALDGSRTLAECGACHSLTDWQPVHFDHNRDAVFALEGAHRGVACASCHPTEQAASGPFLRLRPLAHACSDCHKPGGGK